MLRHADDHQQAEAILHADVAVDAIRPPVHIPLLAQITLTPAPVIVNPMLLQSADGVGGQPLGLIAQQGRQCILVIAGTHTLQIQPGQQLLDTSSPLWYAPSEAKARRRWEEWLELAMSSGLAPVQQFARRLKGYVEGIIASATYRMNTSVLEGMNNKIKVIKRMAYGYRDNDYFFLKIKAAFSGKAR